MHKLKAIIIMEKKIGSHKTWGGNKTKGYKTAIINFFFLYSTAYIYIQYNIQIHIFIDLYIILCYYI